MKKLLLTLFLASFLLIPTLAFAAAETHYCTQSGAGTGDGSSAGNAFSVAAFNTASNWDTNVDTDNGKIGPGDTVYFSGTITTTVTPKGLGVSGDYITLDGYEAGDCDPLIAACSSSAIISGGDGITASTHINGNDYLYIQDFRFTNGRVTVYSETTAATDYVTFRRNLFYDADGTAFTSAKASSTSNLSNITFEYNKFIDFGSSYNASENINFGDINNLVIRYNVMGRTGATAESSANTSAFHQCNGVLFEFNDVYGDNMDTGAAFKEYGNQNCIVRFNKFHDIDGYGLTFNWATTENIYVYCNIFHDNQIGYSNFDGAHDCYTWSNIFYNNLYYGFWTWERGQGIVDDIFFYNNTMAGDGTSDVSNLYPARTAVSLSAGTDLTFKNNIFYDNRPNASTYNQFYEGIASTPALEHNSYFHTAGTASIYWGGAYKTLAEMQTLTKEDDAPAGAIEDPNFTTPGSNVYTLLSTSPCINNGANLGGVIATVTIQGVPYAMDLRDAFLPGLDMSSDDPRAWTVNIGKQSDYGSGWERGAFIYTGDGGLVYPESAIDSPPGNVSGEEGLVVNLQGTASGGTGPYTHSWKKDGVEFSTVEDPGDTTFSTAGNFTVTYTATDSVPLADPSPAAITVTVEAADTTGVLSKAAWTIEAVDSQETTCVSRPATNAIDGDVSTIWHTEWCSTNPVCPHYIVIDLGSAADITRLGYTPRSDGGTNGRIEDYLVYVSNDPESFGAAVASGTWVNSGDQQFTADFVANGRYVKLTGSTSYGSTADTWVSAAEIDLYGAVAATPASITLWWQADTGLDITANEYSAGDTQALANTEAAVGESCTKIGTYGMCFPSALDYFVFDITAEDILADQEGRIGFWFRADAFTAGVTLFSFRYDNTTDVAGLVLAAGGDLSFTWTDNSTARTTLTVDSNLSVDTWYFVEAAWDTTANYREIWINDVSAGSSSEVINDMTGAPLKLRIGNITANAAYVMEDLFIVSSEKTDDLYQFNADTVYNTGAGTPTVPTITRRDFVDPITGAVISADAIYLGDGDALYPIRDTFSEPVNQSGSPATSVETGANDIAYTYTDPQLPGMGNGTIYHMYTPGGTVAAASSHNSTDLAGKAVTGTWVSVDDSTAADLTLPTNGNTDDLYAVVVDTTADTISGFAGVTANGTYTSGTITFRATVADAASNNNGLVATGSSGFPRIALNSGVLETRYAYYASKNDNTTYDLSYVIQPGDRTTDLGTSGNLDVSMGTWQDAAGNNVTVTAPSNPNTLAENAAIVIAAPDTWSIGSTGDYATFTAFDTATYSLDDDVFNYVGNVTENLNTDAAGTSGHTTIVDGNGYTMTGTVTIDQDYWHVKCLLPTENVTVTGNNEVIQSVLIPTGKVLQNTGTGNSFLNLTVAGTLDIDVVATAITNCAFPGTFALANAVSQPVTYCIFRETEAEIEAAGGTLTDKTGCIFGVTNFRFKAGSYKPERGSVLINSGTNLTSPYNEALDRAGVPRNRYYKRDIGAYETTQAAAGM